MSAAVLGVASGRLSRTRTYAVREWRWLPAVRSEFRDGTLTIIVQRAERDGRPEPVKSEWDSYGVQEEMDEYLPDGVRAFLLENETDPDAYGPFRCIVGGMVEFCGCEMGWFDSRRIQRTGCKHRAALSAMLNEGVI